MADSLLPPDDAYAEEAEFEDGEEGEFEEEEGDCGEEGDAEGDEEDAYVQDDGVTAPAAVTSAAAALVTCWGRRPLIASHPCSWNDATVSASSTMASTD